MDRVEKFRKMRFGRFEVDPTSGELSRDGRKIGVQQQPFQVLLTLLLRPGEVVTREELRQQLWADDTYVDFEHGLNAAIKRLRDALGDSADNPQFVETLPRRGYRFIAPVTGSSEAGASASRGIPLSKRLIWAAVIGVLVLAGTGASYRWISPRNRSERLNRSTSSSSDVRVGSRAESASNNISGRAPGIPPGTYTDSCKQQVVQGTILTAVCQKENGRWQTTTLQDFSQCVGDIWNVDGYLNCDIEDTPIDPHDPDLDQKRFFTHLNRAEVYEQRGNYERAIDEYKAALRVSNSVQASCGRLWLAHAYAAAGQRAAAEKIVKQATRSTKPNSPAYCVAQAFAAIDITESLRWLERANQERDPRIPFLATDWRLFSLRSTPRFQELARAAPPTH